jgi:ATP adenylyltransferase
MADYQKNIWAPWRMEYIASLGPGGNDRCFICEAVRRPEADEENLVVWRNERTLVLLNRFPYSSGHMLVAPHSHSAQPEDLPDDVLLEIMQQARDTKRVLEAALNSQGFNIGINLGHCAGAGLPGHLHLHVVPRWAGDTNFMAVLGDVKVIPQSLAEVRRLFIEHAERLGLGPGVSPA